jgi:hypothetical protein
VGESWLYEALCSQTPKLCELWLHEAVCKQRPEVRVTVSYMKLCVERDVNCG